MKNHLITIGVIVLVALGLYAFNSKTTDFTSGGSDLRGIVTGKQIGRAHV